MRVGRRYVQVSNPDKVFFPERGLKKDDLVGYYVDLADCVLPHLRRRPFHMKRYPNGVAGDFFHQKRVPQHPDYVGEQFVRFPSGHSTVFAVVDNAAALAWVINLGCIELHTWHSRVDDIERPDYLLIDLDPTVDGQWPHVREIALVVNDVMDELGLAAYPKTSGATGLHILAPIKPELVFPDVRRFAKALAEEVERRVGDQGVATTTWRVADRRGVRDTRLIDFADVDESLGTFDTVVLLGNNFGVFGSPTQAKRLLRRLRRLTSDRARIVAESRDVSSRGPADAQWHAEYRQRNVERGRLPGQIRIRIRFRRIVGPWFDYPMVSPTELEKILDGTGWRLARTIDSDDTYVAVIEKAARARAARSARRATAGGATSPSSGRRPRRSARASSRA